MPTNRINRLRKESGMNQKELGAMLGVGQTTVSAWETGKNEPDNESMHKTAKFFQVSIGYLMGYESSPQASLTAAEREQYQRENEEAFHKRKMKQEAEQIALEEEPPETMDEDYRMLSDYQEWQETDQTTYFEIFQLNQMAEYLTEEQRKRLLNVARAMFPHAANGLYTDEIVHK